MQAKPPLACHANLVAEWGGVAAREGTERGELRESGLGLGWGRQTSPLLHRSATINHPKSHPYFNTHASQLL